MSRIIMPILLVSATAFFSLCYAAENNLESASGPEAIPLVSKALSVPEDFEIKKITGRVLEEYYADLEDGWCSARRRNKSGSDEEFSSSRFIRYGDGKTELRYDYTQETFNKLKNAYLDKKKKEEIKADETKTE